MSEDWSQKYQPETEKDILISKTVYDKIKQFFNLNFGNPVTFKNLSNSQSVMFLFGPSGCGKRSTIRYLCEQYGVAEASPDQLQIEDNNDEFAKDLNYAKDLMKVFTVASMWYNPSKKVVLLINDLPEIPHFTHKKKFEELVSIYMSKKQRMPIIFILNSHFYNENKVKKYFSEEFFNTQTTVVKLKSYTDAAMKKAIKEVCSKEPRLQRCNSDTLKEDLTLRCNGDLKQALNQLYLHSLKYKNLAYRDRKIRKLKSSTSTQSSDKNFSSENSGDGENSQMAQVKDREFNLFHTLGKFLYNKRVDPVTKQPRTMTSKELIELRPKFYFEPSHLINQLGVDLSLFNLFLHENYLDFYGEIEDVVNMSEAFQESDIIHTSNFRKEGHAIQKYENEFLNTLIISTGLMVHNLTGAERLAQEKTQEKGFKGFKPLNKPKLLSLKSDMRNQAQQIKTLNKDTTIPFYLMATEYSDFMKKENKENVPPNQKRFMNFGSRSGVLDEDDNFVEAADNKEDTVNFEGNSFSQVEFFERTALLKKRSAPLQHIDDDIEDVEDLF